MEDKYYTASGVSAGIDMTLGYMSDMHGETFAKDIAFRIEYTWHSNKNNDPFAIG